MTIAQQSLETRHDIALYKLIDEFSELHAQGRDTLTPGEVQSVLQDICLELRCHFSDLPKIAQTIHGDVRMRSQLPDHGNNSKFVTGRLIDSLVRSL